LNLFLQEMSEAVRDHGGTLLAYRGDGLLAAFGAPIEQVDHADRALEAVREMAGPRLTVFNEWVRANGLGDGFRIGIGVNSGVVMSGNVGSDWRVEYTAIGDTVNTASRLEQMTKDLSFQVLISDTTRAMLLHDAQDLVYVDAAAVRGKVAKANLWTLRT
jgi:adenylate cyclase